MIYVDPIQHYPDCRLSYKDRCHMATDGPLSELHQMATQLGLRRAWFQNKPGHPHYDLTPDKRAQAIRFGAQAVSMLELIRGATRRRWGKGYSLKQGGKRDEHIQQPRTAGWARCYTQTESATEARGTAAPPEKTIPVCFPSVPACFPTLPVFFPGASRLDMLQPSAYPKEGVRILVGVWASVQVVAWRRPDRCYQRKERMRWSEAV